MNVVNSDLEPNLKSYSQLREKIIQNNNRINSSFKKFHKSFLVKEQKITKISKRINQNFTKINNLFNKREADELNFHSNVEENKHNRLNKENSLQDLLNMQTPRGSREEMLLQSQERNRTSYTFYSTNCISNSEKSLFNYNERESLSFNFDNNYNTNFFNNNVNNNNANFVNNNNNNITNNCYFYNSNCNNNINFNCNNNNENNCNLISSGKNSKSDLNKVANSNNVFFSMEKEQEQVADEENSNANLINNSGFTMNCRISEEREPKCGFVKFDIPFEDLKENNLEADLDKINNININNNYNLEPKKQMNKQKESKNNEKDNEFNKHIKASKKKIDAFTKKLESECNHICYRENTIYQINKILAEAYNVKITNNKKAKEKLKIENEAAKREKTIHKANDSIATKKSKMIPLRKEQTEANDDSIFSFLCTSSRNKKEFKEKTITEEKEDSIDKSKEEDKSNCSVF